MLRKGSHESDIQQPMKISDSEPYLIYIRQLLEKTDQDAALCAVLFNKLFQELPDQIMKIELALSLSNQKLAKEITHKLHGSVSFCGFSELESLAHRLESQLSDHDSTFEYGCFLQLKQKIKSFSDFKKAIQDHFNQNTR